MGLPGLGLAGISCRWLLLDIMVAAYFNFSMYRVVLVDTFG